MEKLFHKDAVFWQQIIPHNLHPIYCNNDRLSVDNFYKLTLGIVQTQGGQYCTKVASRSKTRRMAHNDGKTLVSRDANFVPQNYVVTTHQVDRQGRSQTLMQHHCTTTQPTQQVNQVEQTKLKQRTTPYSAGAVGYAVISGTENVTSEQTSKGFENQANPLPQDHAEDYTQADTQIVSQHKTEYIAHISHELRSPLHGIVCALEMLQHSRLTNAQKELVTAASQSADYLLEIVNSLLDFSRIEASQLKLTIDEIDILALLDKVMQTVCLKALKKNLSLRVLVTAEVPQTIAIDSLCLRQILVNLLSNSVKFTDRGQIMITVICQDKQLAISVIDTGRGISLAMQNKVFEPYTQENSHNMGTGLGLSISTRLANMMGGTIKLKSILGEGSCFTLFLPLSRCCKQQHRLSGTVVAPVRLHAQLTLWGMSTVVGKNAELEKEELLYMPGQLWNIIKKRRTISNKEQKNNKQDSSVSEHTTFLPSMWCFKVLIVDDIDVNRLLMMEMLQKLGHQCLLAADGYQALELGKQHIFDLVLLDIHMPEIDGLQTARLWRDKEQGILDPDCLIFSMSADVSSKKKDTLAYQAGINRCFSKPISLKKLARAMRFVEDWQHTRGMTLKPNPIFDKPLLDIFDKHTREQVRTTLFSLHSDLANTYQIKDAILFKEKLHAIKGVVGQAGMHKAVDAVAHMEKTLMNKEWPKPSAIKVLKNLVSLDQAD